MVERFREQLSNESVADRIARMVAQLDQAADDPPPSKGMEAVSLQAESTLEKIRLSLAFSQEALSSPPAGRAPRKARPPRLATGRRRPGL